MLSIYLTLSRVFFTIIVFFVEHWGTRSRTHAHTHIMLLPNMTVLVHVECIHAIRTACSKQNEINCSFATNSQLSC